MNIFNRGKEIKQLSSELKDLKNLLNQALYQYTNNASYLPDANNDTYIGKGYKGNLQIYSVVSAITQRCTGITLKHMNGENEIANSDLIKRLNNPNPMQTKDEFIEAMASWLLLTGNLYIYTIKAEDGLNKGKPIEMWLLPSHLTEIVGGGIMEPVRGYKVNIGSGYALEINKDDVIHIKYFNPGFGTSGEHLYGQSPIQAAIGMLGANNSGYTALNKSFGNGAPAGILTGTADKDMEYTPEQAHKLQEEWKKNTAGADKIRKMLFHRSPLQFIQMGWSPVDMDIVSLLEFTWQDVCNIYHAPIHLFNSKAATLDNYKEARKAIYTDCVIPFFDRLLPVFNAYLCPAYQAGSTIDYDLSNISELNQDLQTLKDAWWLTGNEKRTQMGLTEHPDPLMDEIIYPVNAAPQMPTEGGI